MATYKTINIRPITYERLLLYKVAGKDFDDVINELMDIIDVETFYKMVLEEHRKRIKVMKDGDYLSIRTIDDLA